jgi:hypothetical protein
MVRSPGFEPGNAWGLSPARLPFRQPLNLPTIHGARPVDSSPLRQIPQASALPDAAMVRRERRRCLPRFDKVSPHTVALLY